MSRYVEVFGVIAAFLQAVGYALYLYDSVRKTVEPNAATWLMFAYGTILLTVLEWDNHASNALLALPATCALMGIIVAALCAKRGTLRWPRGWEDVWEVRAFKYDIALTVLYFGTWVLTVATLLDEADRSLAALVILFGSNATTITAFIPILRSTWRDPSRERPFAWTIWACAYTILGVTTIIEEGGWWTVLLLYPVSNALLHGMIAWLSRPERRKHRLHAAE
ncbi:hypothetical protein C4556_01195 [Candidatus Parcubacteria bacterium]|nr:MAG: hypothetical protein C4556_01195 [Candidatus Parcubacteria bacterium]